jgi:single-strand DNA-binding protein
MSNGINKAILIGNLGCDPEKYEATNGTIVTTLNVATTERYRDGATNEYKDTTEWHRIVVFGKRAETAAQYLSKGALVGVVGKIKTRLYMDKNDVERKVTEIVADDVRFLDCAKKSDSAEVRHSAA